MEKTLFQRISIYNVTGVFFFLKTVPHVITLLKVNISYSKSVISNKNEILIELANKNCTNNGLHFISIAIEPNFELYVYKSWNFLSTSFHGFLGYRRSRSFATVAPPSDVEQHFVIVFCRVVPFYQ